jgi:peptidoglycan hydrolase CwlO-like protein
MIERIAKIVALILLATTPLSASAQKNDKAIEAQRKRVEQYKKSLDNTKREVDNLKKEKASAQQQVRALEKQVKMRKEYIGEVEAEHGLVSREMSAAEHDIDSLEQVLQRNREIYAEAVRIAYRNHKQNSSKYYLFSSKSVTEAARRMAEMQHIAVSRRELADSIAQQTERIAQHRAKLAVRSQELDSVTRALERERRALEDDRVAAQRSFNSLSKREKDAINEQRKQEKLHNSAVAELQKLIKNNTVGASFSKSTRGLNLPVVGGTLTEEGYGATIVGKAGDSVHTMHEGRVEEIVRMERTNHYTVYLSYGAHLVTFTNLGSVCVKKGDVLKKDQKIGTIGRGINSRGAEYHYIRLAVYERNSQKQLFVSDFFKKK